VALNQNNKQKEKNMAIALPELPYTEGALAPHIRKNHQDPVDLTPMCFRQVDEKSFHKALTSGIITI
jgi:hypothetical protein